MAVKYDGEERREKERWHVGKEIPITFVATVFLQTIVFVWSASGLYSKVENVVEQLKTFAVERYTKDDARRDKELMLLVVDALKSRDGEIERRMLRCEQHIADQSNGRSK